MVCITILWTYELPERSVTLRRPRRRILDIVCLFEGYFGTRDESYSSLEVDTRSISIHRLTAFQNKSWFKKKTGEFSLRRKLFTNLCSSSTIKSDARSKFTYGSPRWRSYTLHPVCSRTRWQIAEAHRRHFPGDRKWPNSCQVKLLDDNDIILKSM